MTLKQLSWRRSNLALFLFSLLLVPMYSFSADPSVNVSSAAPHNRGKEEAALEFHGEPIEVLESAYRDAPFLAKQMVMYLNNPKVLRGMDCRYIFLAGDPGVGKTTLAKAIAYKADWDFKELELGDIMRNDRNASAIRLFELLKEIVAQDVETVVFIDELNQLLEKYNSERHDTDATSKVLWTFLDKQLRNKKFFFIGAMNRVDKLPPQIKDRILARCIRLFPPKSAADRKRIFIGKLLGDDVVLTPEADVYIEENMPKLEGYTQRNFAEFALAVRLHAATEDVDSKMNITLEHLQFAVDTIQKTKEYAKHGQEDETDEERRFKQSLELQEQHFVQQQMMAVYTAEHLYTPEGTSTFSDDNRRVLFSHFSQKQNKIVAEIENREIKTLKDIVLESKDDGGCSIM